MTKEYTLVTVRKRHKPDERVRGRNCCAVGLFRGDCSMTMAKGSWYCYYHHKVACGLLEPEEPQRYPVLPLPTFGYTLRLTTKNEG